MKKKDTLHIYKRLSRESKNSHSLENQERLGIKKSVELDMNYEIHDEDVVSGGSDTLENRPVFSELIDRIMNDEI